MSQHPQHKALYLRAEGDYAILEIENVKGEWIELIRERLDSPFSHIIEPAGIENKLKEALDAREKKKK